METIETPHLDFLQAHNKTPEQFAQYQSEITEALQWANRNIGAPDTYTNEAAGDIIIISWLLSDHASWITRFNAAWMRALTNANTQGEFFGAICRELATPQVKEAWTRIHPDLDTHKWFDDPTNAQHHTTTTRPAKTTTTAKPTHLRAQLWKLHPKWEHLRPSSKKVFLEMHRRAQHPKKKGTFPWGRFGVTSLHKFTHLSEHQVKRARDQLERYGLIKRITRGYPGKGGAVYFVFKTPKMSGAYSHKATRKTKP